MPPPGPHPPFPPPPRKEEPIRQGPYRRSLIALALVAAAVLVATLGREWLERRRAATEIRTLRGEVADARGEAEACRAALSRQEDAFRRFDVRVDSLEAEVRRFEALDERGVPRPIYPEYLEHVERFNDSVAAWEIRAEGLRAAETRCREVVAAHNGLADSLRSRLEREGLLGEER